MDGNQSAAQVLDYIVPTVSVTAIKLSRHTGRDCRYPEHREVNLARPPWPLGSGIPYWNDGVFLNLMAVKQELGNEQQMRIAVRQAGLCQNDNCCCIIDKPRLVLKKANIDTKTCPVIMTHS